MLSLSCCKHFTTASFNIFIPNKIDFSSINNLLPYQLTFNKNNNQKFKRFFSQSNLESKIEILKEKAKWGDHDSQYELGLYYLSKDNLYADDEKGIYYIKTAAENNHLLGCYEYSIYLKNGIIVKKNLPQSLHYLTFAADHNLEIAQFKLATEYYTGECYPQDLSKSLHYFCLSAYNANVESCKIAGILFMQGIGCKRDIELAKKYFQIGSQLNCPICKYQLSIIYNVENKKESFDLLKDAADLGFSVAQTAYGKHLLIDEKNEKEAEKYFRLAARQNDPESNFKLWEILKGSKDKERNEEADLFLKKAADLGHEIAMQYDCRITEYDESSGYPILSSLDFETKKIKNVGKKGVNFELPSRREIYSNMDSLKTPLNLNEKFYIE